MGDERLEAVLRRVADLEAEVRRWRRAAMALVLSAVALTTLGAAVPRGRVVEAQKFVLKDAAGGVRAELGPSDNNKSVALRFNGEARPSCLLLGIVAEGSLPALDHTTG